MSSGSLLIGVAAASAYVTLWWFVWFRQRTARWWMTLALLASALAVVLALTAPDSFYPATLAVAGLQTLGAVVFVYAKHRATRGTAAAATGTEASPPQPDIDTLADKLKTAELKIETLEAVKTDFVTIAGHELQTPLAQLRGAIDLLDALHQAQVLDDSQVAELVTTLRAAEERLESLVADMLDASQVALGQFELKLAETTIEAVVREAVEPLTAGIRQRRLSVGVVDLRNLPPIMADQARLAQAVRNVILNAVKFTPDGGKVKISAQTATEASTSSPVLILKVADSGVGVAATDLELIFHPFYRAHSPEVHSSGAVKFMGAGPGFGLHIAKGIVEAHGGAMWAESACYDPQTCPGTTIYIRLPLTEPRAQVASSSDSSPAV